MMTAAAKAIRAKVGDVFRIPAASDQFVYGQVVEKKGPQHLVVVFRAVTDSVEEAISSGFELAGIVFDAKLRNGDWPIVANRPPVKVSEPWFVLGHEGLENLRLENFEGSSQRLIRPAEAARHGHRNISYPMLLQWAVEATHGQREWSADLEIFKRLGSELAGAA